MAKGQSIDYRPQLKEKGITISSIAKEYNRSYQFVHAVLKGEQTSAPLIEFVKTKLKTA